MRKQTISMAMLVTLLLLGSSTADSKKKPEKPVLETFVANVIDSSGATPHLTVTIQEFSTDDEVHELAQSYARGGEDSLRNAMGKSKKGYFTLGSSETMHLRIIQDRPTGAGRRLVLVGEAPTAFSPGEAPNAASSAGMGPRVVLVGHRGSNYSVIQLDVDGQGNGKGIMYIYCVVGFNQQGQLTVKPMAANSPLNVASTARQPYQVVIVQRVK